MATLQDQITQLRKQQMSLRADLLAYRLFTMAMVTAMNPTAREALLHNVKQLGERAMSSGLFSSRSPDDSTLHAMQAAVDRLIQSLKDLPTQ